MRVRFIAKWYDLWVGAYWDRDNRRLFILPLPCLGVVLDFGRRSNLEPHERIELELFRRALQDVPTLTGTDIGDLLNMTTDLIRSGSMGKDEALAGLVKCLIYRVAGYRSECLAHRRESEEWSRKWRAALDNRAPLVAPRTGPGAPGDATGGGA